MTVGIGVLCDNGQSAIIAADRMVTSGLMIEFEHESPKIERLSGQCFASTAGDALAHTELFDRVHQEIDSLRQPTVEQVAERITCAYQEVRQKCIAERTLRPRGISSLGSYYDVIGALPGPILERIEFEIGSYDYGLHILLAGRSHGKARIYYIQDPGTSSCFDAIHFHAIGSGFNLAVGRLIGAGFHHGMDLPEALMVLLDAREAANNAPGVGEATDVAIITPNFCMMVTRERIAGLFEINGARHDGAKDWSNQTIEFITCELERQRHNAAGETEGEDDEDAGEDPQAEDAGGVQGENPAD